MKGTGFSPYIDPLAIDAGLNPLRANRCNHKFQPRTMKARDTPARPSG
jgi:hypothetical protein